MNINFSVAAQWNKNSGAQVCFRNPAASTSTISPRASGGAPDTVEISEQSRQQLLQAGSVAATQAVSIPAGNQSLISARNLYRYANAGSGAGNVGMDFMNASRLDLSSRIDSVLKAAGINLRPDERLSIAVDNDNKFTVAGIKDKKKAKQIAEALNADEKLGLDLRKHSAAGRSVKLARLVAQAASGGPEYQEQVEQSLTDPGMRAFVLDNYLQDSANVMLSNLSVERDEAGNATIVGGDESLAALLDADAGLAESLVAVIESGETPSYEVHFEFANGMISDEQTESEAREGIKALYEKINSAIGEFNEMIREEEEQENGFWDPQNTQVISGFSIRLSTGNGFEIMDLDKLTGRQARALQAAVSGAIADYTATKDAVNNSPMLGKDALNRMASLNDIVNVYLNQHQFEHGDTNEYQHMVEISSGSLGPQIKVVSPEADAALENTIQQYAGELGKGLRERLEGAGVDVGEGIEVEIDASGKMRVVGDLSDPNLRQAQSILDSLAKELSAGAPADQNSDVGVMEGRTDLKARGIGDYGEYAEDGDKDPAAVWLQQLGFSAVSLPDEEPSARVFHSMSNLKPVSDVTAISSPVGIGGNAAEATSLEALASADGFTPGDLAGLYRRIKDLFTQFHDDGDNKKVRFVIA